MRTNTFKKRQRERAPEEKQSPVLMPCRWQADTRMPSSLPRPPSLPGFELDRICHDYMHGMNLGIDQHVAGNMLFDLAGRSARYPCIVPRSGCSGATVASTGSGSPRVLALASASDPALSPVAPASFLGRPGSHRL